MEEPCCEPQAVALYYVSRMAKEFVKVLISGEGGDEAFAGYSVYRNMLWLERVKSVAGPLKGPLAAGISLLNQFVKSKRMAKYPSLVELPIESYYYSRTSGPASFFNSHGGELYTKDFARYVDKGFSINPATRCLSNSAGNGPVNRMLYVDTKTSLPDDLLLKADKMTMANSIELRVPLLDHKLLEFAASLPENFKVNKFTTKYLAKMALKDRLPKGNTGAQESRLPGSLRHVDADRIEGLGQRRAAGSRIHRARIFQSPVHRGANRRRCANTTLSERDPVAGGAGIVARQFSRKSNRRRTATRCKSHQCREMSGGHAVWR